MVIQQNIAFTFGTKAVFAVLSLAGHSSMWVAADSVATLFVVFDALTLLRKCRYRDSDRRK